MRRRWRRFKEQVEKKRKIYISHENGENFWKKGKTVKSNKLMRIEGLSKYREISLVELVDIFTALRTRGLVEWKFPP